MLRLTVTASGTQPIDASSATYIATSASIIRVVPDIVDLKTALGMKCLGKLGREQLLELGRRQRCVHCAHLPCFRRYSHMIMDRIQSAWPHSRGRDTMPAPNPATK